MRHKDFKIGKTFYTGAGEWVCTDVGTRVIVAVEKKYAKDMRGICELVFDENDFAGCYASKEAYDRSVSN